MVRAVNFINWPIGKILAYGAAFGPRHVAGGGPGRGSPGECGNGPLRGSARGGVPRAGGNLGGVLLLYLLTNLNYIE